MTTVYNIAYARMLYMCPKCIGYPEAVDNTHAHSRTHAHTHTLTISAYFDVCSRMPRVYIRKTDNGQVPREVMDREPSRQ